MKTNRGNDTKWKEYTLRKRDLKLPQNKYFDFESAAAGLNGFRVFDLRDRSTTVSFSRQLPNAQKICNALNKVSSLDEAENIIDRFLKKRGKTPSEDVTLSQKIQQLIEVTNEAEEKFEEIKNIIS